MKLDSNQVLALATIFLIVVAAALAGALYFQPVSQPEVPLQLSKQELLVFTATWCKACRAAEPEVAKLKIRTTKVDVDVLPSVWRRYRLPDNKIPLFVLLECDKVFCSTNDLNEIKRWIK